MSTRNVTRAVARLPGSRLAGLRGYSLGLKLLSFALVFGAWEIAGRIPISLAFPPFSATAQALFDMTVDGTLLSAYGSTLKPLIIGVVISAVFGIACGIGMGLSRVFEWFTLPVFVILQAAPVAAVIPVLTYLYGIGLASKVAAVMIMAAPVIVLNSYKGIRSPDPSLIQMCRSFLGTPRQAIVKIIIPSASGMIFAGLRLGLGAGFIGVILAELLITPTGIGDLITYHRSIAEYPRMLASIASIIAFAALTITFMQKSEVLLRPETKER